jgi:hypothetical protein
MMTKTIEMPNGEKAENNKTLRVKRPIEVVVV